MIARKLTWIKLPGRHQPHLFSLFAFMLFFMLFARYSASAQSKHAPIATLIRLTEKAYGTNDKLINGIIYLPEHPNAHGTPYYPSGDYREGIVYINGSAYNKQQIKYNASIQKLILKGNISKSAIVEILLNNSRVDSFQVDKSKFINARHVGIPEWAKGFFEVFNHGEYKFLAYRTKVFQDVYSRKYPFGKYIMLPSTYFYIQGNRIKKIKTKKDFYALFPTERKRIKKYIRKHKIIFKKATGEELKELLNFSERNH